MANVRLDQNGIPKGAVYEWTEPQVHRSGVAAPDASDPEGVSGAIATEGYEGCRFDVSIEGAGVTELEVQLLFWNSRQGLWFGGDSFTFASIGRYAIVADVRGATVFLKVTAFSGTSFSFSADYSLS
jgi:hypothetical protein